MATGTAQSTMLPPPPPVAGESRERERIIHRQLARTGLQLRLIDLASGIATWIIGVLLLFIAAALVDHFIGLGRTARFAAPPEPVGGSLWYLAAPVGPLLLRTINPEHPAP